MSRHCKHRSTAKTCASFAYLLLACSECHERFNHGASQSKYCACFSAAGDEAEFMYSAPADLKMLQFTRSFLVRNIIKRALSDVCQKAKTIVILVVCLPWPLKHKLHAHMSTGRPPFQEAPQNYCLRLRQSSDTSIFRLNSSSNLFWGCNWQN
jgi:hypothetical protein